MSIPSRPRKGIFPARNDWQCSTYWALLWWKHLSWLKLLAMANLLLVMETYLPVTATLLTVMEMFQLVMETLLRATGSQRVHTLYPL
jgi:hypothetical protein|eukprot:g7181.t1